MSIKQFRLGDSKLEFSEKIEEASNKALELCKKMFEEIESVEEYNQQKD